eukprot:2901545-Amphidinium_carterae.1
MSKAVQTSHACAFPMCVCAFARLQFTRLCTNVGSLSRAVSMSVLTTSKSPTQGQQKPPPLSEFKLAGTTAIYPKLMETVTKA